MNKFTIITWVIGVSTLLWMSFVKRLILNIFSIINTFTEKQHKHDNPETRFEIIKFTLDTYLISKDLLGWITLGMYKFHFKLRFKMLEFERDLVGNYDDQVQLYNKHFPKRSVVKYIKNLIKKNDISLFNEKE